LFVFHGRRFVGGLLLRVNAHSFSADCPFKKRLKQLFSSVFDRGNGIGVILPVCRCQTISDKPYSLVEWRIFVLIQSGSLFQRWSWLKDGCRNFPTPREARTAFSIYQKHALVSIYQKHALVDYRLPPLKLSGGFAEAGGQCAPSAPGTGGRDPSNHCRYAGIAASVLFPMEATLAETALVLQNRAHASISCRRF
jgi:hypothetical protein